MRILVFGAGAIGTVIGGLLRKNGQDVVLFGRERIMRPIRDRGLEIIGIWGEHTVQEIPAVWDSGELGCVLFDAILLSVKSFDTADAIAQAAPFLSANGLVYSLQNGVGNVEQIAKVVGSERTIGGRVIFGARIPQPAVSEVTVMAEEIRLGPVSPATDYARVETMASLFTDSGIPTLPTREIHKYLWTKVLYNSALNPLSAIFGVTYGELAENPVTRDLMESIIREIFAVTRAAGIPLFWDSPEGYEKKFFTTEVPRTAAHRSSMLQAIESGRQTDIDALNGYVVRLARQHGMNVPVNEMLVRLIQAKEAFASDTL